MPLEELAAHMETCEETLRKPISCKQCLTNVLKNRRYSRENKTISLAELEFMPLLVSSKIVKRQLLTTVQGHLQL